MSKVETYILREREWKAIEVARAPYHLPKP